MRFAVTIRAGLGFFALVSLALGGVIMLAPEWFYAFSWVNLGMPYNPHLLLDHGAQYLAVAVVLGGAAWSLHPAFVRAALGGYAVWAAAHFLIHVRYREHLALHTSTTEANTLVTVLGSGVVLSLLLLGLSLARPADARFTPEPGASDREGSG